LHLVGILFPHNNYGMYVELWVTVITEFGKFKGKQFLKIISSFTVLTLLWWWGIQITATAQDGGIFNWWYFQVDSKRYSASRYEICLKNLRSV